MKILLFLLCLVNSVSSQRWDGVIVTQSDYQSLQAFKSELIDPNGFLRSWNDTGYGACSGSWTGIKCARGQVIVIQLPWRGLGGRITSKINQLQSLRKLSLHNNVITGSIPMSLGLLPNLRGLQLFNNRLSGSIPASLGLSLVLQTLDFSNNSLSGSIPPSIANSTRLLRLDLSHNQLSGEIPVGVTESNSLMFLALEYNNLSGTLPNSFNESSFLRDVNLSHNQLSGEIPSSLDGLQNLQFFDISYNNLSGSVPVNLSQKFNSSAFVGNSHLCGYSAATQCPTSPPEPSPPDDESPVRGGRKLGIRDIFLILFGVLLLFLVVACFVLTFCLIRKRRTEEEANERRAKREKGIVSSSREGETDQGSEEAGGKLLHFDGSMAFGADDLLCASADILGKSTYGTVYRATMEDGIQVAVKRLRERVTIEQTGLENEVNVLGKIRHPNLLALRAYYIGPKGEKLLVFDYMPKGSLATFLHARAPNTRIDWPTRMKIAKGITRGLLYLHNKHNIIHGNLTSNNVLLDEYKNAKVADYSLWRLMTDVANANVITTAGALGYRAPELSVIKKANTKTDVYSLGVIMLELLTGKSPREEVNGVDLRRWVASTVREERINEVFDLELMRDDSLVAGHDELWNTLKLALHCVDPSPSARPEAYEVLDQLEEIRPEIIISSGDESAAALSPIGDD